MTTIISENIVLANFETLPTFVVGEKPCSDSEGKISKETRTWGVTVLRKLGAFDVTSIKNTFTRAVQMIEASTDQKKREQYKVITIDEKCRELFKNFLSVVGGVERLAASYANEENKITSGALEKIKKENVKQYQRLAAIIYPKKKKNKSSKKSKKSPRSASTSPRPGTPFATSASHKSKASRTLLPFHHHLEPLEYDTCQELVEEQEDRGQEEPVRDALFEPVSPSLLQRTGSISPISSFSTSGSGFTTPASAPSTPIPARFEIEDGPSISLTDIGQPHNLTYMQDTPAPISLQEFFGPLPDLKAIRNKGQKADKEEEEKAPPEPPTLAPDNPEIDIDEEQLNSPAGIPPRLVIDRDLQVAVADRETEPTEHTVVEESTGLRKRLSFSRRKSRSQSPYIIVQEETNQGRKGLSRFFPCLKPSGK